MVTSPDSQSAPFSQRWVKVLRPEGFRDMAYTQWGDPHGKRVCLCVHGLTRNGRDFDDLAAALSGDPEVPRRVLCPDVLGRGKSDWLVDSTGYDLAAYAADMATLIARSGAEEVDWVGTSMGGLIGMLIAASPGTPIRRLVLNDVGAFIPKAALERISEYVSRPPVFDDLKDLEAYLRDIHRSFGPLSDAAWARVAEHSHRIDENGRIAMHYDRRIAASIAQLETLEDVDLWPVWEAIRVPTLVVRGAESDLLTAATAQRMTHSGPQAKLLEIPGVGHAPWLASADQIQPIVDFLA
ncbi:alpha/beta fold hydrolase [Roseospirillum parvum]|uniref:Pimeloyl-ACP methyl ester carboxylesterase n=1 Tax=Roseospirillum parvum TaxID=83401 RepID=A0A1G7Y0C8_9PROT|nr:alpha/beta hydrolase [Roseospirillum parvum]SDG89841.1 Pimeloyl-ACP methyl ester carboxylesterase [Roseospirillum parvum]